MRLNIIFSSLFVMKATEKVDSTTKYLMNLIHWLIHFIMQLKINIQKLAYM